MCKVLRGKNLKPKIHFEDFPGGTDGKRFFFVVLFCFFFLLIALFQGKEQQLCFAGAAVKR